MAPLLVAMPLIGVLSNVGQSGLVLSGKGMMPDLSRINPMSYVVEGARAAFLNDFGGHQFWVGLAVAAALAALGLGWATRTFTRQSS